LPSMKIRFIKTIRIIVIVFFTWFAVHTIFICFDGLKAYRGNADVAIVLGNVVFADSSVSPWLQGRLDKALFLYNSGRVKTIFLSGGKGDHGVSEGDGMKRYLRMRNVPLSDLISDNQGNNTFLSAKDFIALNDSLHFTSAIVVTSFYHITRAKYIIRKLGFKQVEGVSSDRIFLTKDWFALIREFFAFYKYAIFY
jgi:vancomycin permeability regulator SanA